MTPQLLLAALVALLAMPVTAAEPPLGGLLRQATLGVAVEGGEGGARVVAVAEGSTAAKAGVRTGDIITSLNGTATADEFALVSEVGKLRAGAAVRLGYVRNGRAGQGRASALARSLESYEGAAVRYGAFAYRGGQLRDIVVTPSGAGGDAPVVYLIQGYNCQTVEAREPTHPYHELIQGLAERGIATYRIEKPGMGDSTGGPACRDTDFDVELGAFRAGLHALTTQHGVAPARVVLFGHSMGGVQAPLLAAEQKGLRGVAVYGTILRRWRDYEVDLFRLQGFLAVGADPVESEVAAEGLRPLLDRIYGSTASLTQIAAESPAHAQHLRESLGWDGSDQIRERAVAYWRGVDRQRLTQAWRDAQVPTLAIYGEADFAAIDDRDHRLIAEVVNHYRPGTGNFVLLPRTGHGFALEGARAEVRNAAAEGPVPAYNPELTKVVADWIDRLTTPSAP